MPKDVHASLPNTDQLPLRFRGRQWYLRKRMPSGRRIEYGLGTSNKAEAERRARQVLHDHLNAEQLTAWQAKVAAGLAPGGWLRRMSTNVAVRSKTKGGRLSLEAIEMIARRCGGFCEVSGLPLHVGNEKKHPMQPSIDRIDSTQGYEPANVRMVALAVNYCMSHWGEQVFLRIAAAMLARHLGTIAGVGYRPGEGFAGQSSGLQRDGGAVRGEMAERVGFEPTLPETGKPDFERGGVA